MAIFFLVRSVAEAILKINSEILYRFAPKFFPNALIKSASKPRVGIVPARSLGICVDGSGKSGRIRRSAQVLRSRKLNCFRKRDKIRRVFVQGLQCLFAQSPRTVCAKHMRAAVYRVHRLPIASRSGIARRERLMRSLKRRENVLKRICGERPLHRALQSAKQSDSMLFSRFRLNG